MKAAEALVDCLLRESVDTVFGIPGSKFLEALDALGARPDEIRFITTRHEQGAAFMAMGYALARRSVGVCYATLGPGTTNLVTGIADAYKNAVPVVALGGMMASKYLGRDSWQEIDQASVLRPVTKESAVVPEAASLPLFLRRAFRMATSGLPGPVYLAVPVDQLSKELPYEPWDPASYRGLPPELSVGEGALDEVLALVNAAEAPVLLAGREVKWDGLGPALLRLAEALNVPVLTTAEGYGGVPTEHPLYLGPTGKPGWPVANECLAAADLVVALGVKFDFHGTGFDHAFLPARAKLVHASRFPGFIGATFPATRGVVAPLEALLRGLRERSARLALPDRETASWSAKASAWRRSREEQVEALREARPTKPQWLASALSRFAGPETFFAVDGGNFKRFFGKYTDLRGSELFKDDGYGCVGCAFPTALGYKAGKPGARVFCVTGDMGYLMNGGELETAVRENLPVVAVIFNDQGLGNIREYQNRNFAGRHIGVDYAPVDYGAVARAFGAHGETVTEPAEVEPALQRAVDSGKPAVVNVVLDPGELAPK